MIKNLKYSTVIKYIHIKTPHNFNLFGSKPFKYILFKLLHLRRVISYNPFQFPHEACSIVVRFNAAYLQLLISLAANQSTHSCEVGMLRSIIVRGWTLCITCAITYFYGNF